MLLDAQRNALLMYTSCGWFFNDLAGIETIQVMKYDRPGHRPLRAARRGLPVDAFLEVLAEAQSNDPEQGTGCDLCTPRSCRTERLLASYRSTTGSTALSEGVGGSPSRWVTQARRVQWPSPPIPTSSTPSAASGPVWSAWPRRRSPPSRTRRLQRRRLRQPARPRRGGLPHQRRDAGRNTRDPAPDRRGRTRPPRIPRSCPCRPTTRPMPGNQVIRPTKEMPWSRRPPAAAPNPVRP